MPRLALLLALLALHAPARAQGTLRLLARTAAGSIDPQINYTAQYWQIFAGVYDGLVAFRKVEGPAGTDIVPDLATDVPDPTPTPNGGLAYRFHLRRGLRFSNGAPLGPADVVASFRRIFQVGSPTAETFFGAIEGAPACLAAPATCALPGVQAGPDADTITITLTRPDPEFLQKLALPHASILPAATPAHDTGTAPIPGTGPYRITSYDPNQALILDRNPHFAAWSPEAQPPAISDSVRYEFGLDPETQVTAILNNQADWMFDAPPPDRLPDLPPAQVRLDPAYALWFVALNTRIPPFDDLRVRRAFNLATDRRAPIRLFGGSRLARPQCQAIPPGLPGYIPYCPYPLDLPAARALVAESGRAGQPVTLVVDDSPVSQAIGTYLLDVLADIGLRPRLQSLSANIQFSYIQNTANHVQASLTSWYADFPSANNILSGNFGCAAFHPGSNASTNIPGYCDPTLDTALATALRAQDWPGVAAIDHALTDAAPAVILFTPNGIDLVSTRIQDFTYHPTFHWLFQLARTTKEETPSPDLSRGPPPTTH